MYVIIPPYQTSFHKRAKLMYKNTYKTKSRNKLLGQSEAEKYLCENIRCGHVLKQLVREGYEFSSKLSNLSEKREQTSTYRNYGVHRIKAE